MSYSPEEISAFYALARRYYELGYLSASERILGGLVEVDDGLTPSRVALGIVKLESGKPDEAIQIFRSAVKAPRRAEDSLSGKLGLVAAFLFLGDIERATSLLKEIQPEIDRAPSLPLRNLWEAFAMRCGVL